MFPSIGRDRDQFPGRPVGARTVCVRTTFSIATRLRNSDPEVNWVHSKKRKVFADEQLARLSIDPKLAAKSMIAMLVSELSPPGSE